MTIDCPWYPRNFGIEEPREIIVNHSELNDVLWEVNSDVSEKNKRFYSF